MRNNISGLNCAFTAVQGHGWACHVALVVKNLPPNAGDIRDTGSIPGLGRSPAGGQGNTLQYACLENPMDREPGGLQSMGSHRVRYDRSNLVHTQGHGWSLFRLFTDLTHSLAEDGHFGQHLLSK